MGYGLKNRNIKLVDEEGNSWTWRKLTPRERTAATGGIEDSDARVDAMLDAMLVKAPKELKDEWKDANGTAFKGRSVQDIPSGMLDQVTEKLIATPSKN